MFEQLRDSLRGFSARLDPEERRRVSGTMREALVHAKLGLRDLRDAVAATDARLRTELTELGTIRRRQGFAAQIHDAETVAIAERFAAQHTERVTVLEAKLMVQQQELALADREYAEMAGELRRAMSGLSPGGASNDTAAQREVDALLSDDPLAYDAAVAANEAEAGGSPARKTRVQREVEADARLAELKRRMGK